MRPVFIGGCPRSGTTMLGALLGAHPRCLAIPEATFKFALARSRLSDFDPRRTLEKICRVWGFRIWEVDVQLPDDLDEISTFERFFEFLVRTYGAKTGKPHPALWIDHGPDNIRHLVTLLDVFKEALVVHLVRDARAVVASVLPLDWGPNTVVRAGAWWEGHLAHGLAAEKMLADDRIIHVRYEDVVRHPEEQLDRLCRFLGIDHDPAMVLGGGFQVPDYTREQHLLVGKRPDPSRLDGWEKKLTRRQLEILEHRVGELLQYLGYERRTRPEAHLPSRYDQLRSDLVEFYRQQIVNRIRARRRRQKSLRRLPAPRTIKPAGGRSSVRVIHWRRLSRPSLRVVIG